MIGNDMMKRIKTAAGFQKQAIRALLPEGMDGHLTRIESELKEMFTEIMAGMLTGCSDGMAKTGGAGEGTDNKVKKVSID